MRTIRTLAPAKVNLTFDILGPLPGGYHQVETLLQSVDLQDEITVRLEPSEKLCVTIKCLNDKVPISFPLDDSNLMAKAAKLYLNKASAREAFEVAIEIEKNIPIGAGLAGGSTDAAAVLVALNELFAGALAIEELLQLGKLLGADVPFCITGGTAVGTQRGDELRALACNPELSYCIVKPKVLSVSTPWAYQQFDAYNGSIKKPDLPKALASLSTGEIQAAIDAFGNVFEPVIFAAYPELVPIKQQLLKMGCWYCQLSGSGPAMFAIVANREQAHFLRRKLLKTDELEFDYVRFPMPDVGPPLECYIAQSIDHGVSILS